ncbi:uncharacterized protein TNCV_772991 [Trichonephila clavipes]|nr:uncharacterized protein TNCV_772991 [Trichonephila clavipes]
MEFNRFEGQGVLDNRRFDSRRRGGQSDHRFHNQGGQQGSSRNGAFKGRNVQNRVLEVRNNNLIIWKKGRRVTVNIDQVREYHTRQLDTNSFDSTNETLYEGKRSSNGSSRSHPGKSKSSRKTLSDESKGRKLNKGTAGLEDLRLKRKVRLNGSVERNDKKRSKICRKSSLQGSEHEDQKRPTPVPPQGKSILYNL